MKAMVKPGRRVLLKTAGLMLAGLAAAPVAAQEGVPDIGRYMPRYPGMYFSGALGHDARDGSYDQSGSERAGAAPQAGGETRFPTELLQASFTWHFPMFEADGLPFFSSRTHLARVTLRYGRTRTEGALADYVAKHSGSLSDRGDGIGDTTLEFGSFLLGAQDWRSRTNRPFALLALVGVNVPTGVYERNAPNSIGTNTWAVHAKFGAHWQPWPGTFVEAGGGLRKYARNEEGEFGGLAPHRQGRDRLLDIGVSQRLLQGLYAGIGWSQRRGDSNEYRNPQFSPNPDAPSPPPNSDTYPTPGLYHDGGTQLETVGLSLHYFLSQRWLAAVQYTRPLGGRSGQFLLPYTNRTPAHCIVGAANCQTTDSGSAVLVDGMGPARSYSSDSVMLTLDYNFDLGDFFTCAGCQD